MEGWDRALLIILCLYSSMGLALGTVVATLLVRLRTSVFASNLSVAIALWVVSIALFSYPFGSQPITVVFVDSIRQLNWLWVFTPALVCVGLGARVVCRHGSFSGRCDECGYSLHGLPAERTHCPECGCEIKEDAKETMRNNAASLSPNGAVQDDMR